MEHGDRSAVVCDELSLVRVGVATLLGALDVAVAAEAHGGREAAELVRFHVPTLAVVGLPADMPAVEAVRRVRAAAGEIRLLALVAVAQVGDPGAFVEAGADGLALRAGTAAETSDALEAVVGARRYVAPSLSAGFVGTLEPVAPTREQSDLLTFREREVLALLARGVSNRDIATALSVTLATVKSHLVHVYAKLEVRNRSEALSRAVSLGILA